MRSFVYFVEGFEGGCPSHADLARAGLAYAIPKRAPFASRGTEEGPPGSNYRGVMIVNGSEGEELFIKNYEWTKMPLKAGAPQIWLGVSPDRARRPGPEDLQREKMCTDGYPVELCDGNEWFIPIVRNPTGETTLPRVLSRGANGRPEWKIHPDYAELFDRSLEIRDSAFGLNDKQLSTEDLLWLGSAALSVNYRIGAAEVCALELLSSDNIREIAKAVLDGPNLERLLAEYHARPKADASAPGQI